MGATGRSAPSHPEEARVEVSVTSRPSGDRTVVHVAGEIDVYTAPALREELAGLVDAGKTDLVVDLTDVSFMDSTGSASSSAR